MLRQWMLMASLCTVLAACGGGASPPPPAATTVMLTASPAALGSGQSTTLNWSSTNAATCTASGGWSGARAVSGSEPVGPLTADTAFTLSCSDSRGSAAAQTVTVRIVPPPTVTLTAAASAVTLNHTTTLTWSSTDATACTAAGGWSGAKAVAGAESSGVLAANTRFTLTCNGPAGAQTATVDVTVDPPPAGMVVVNGRITFDRIAFRALPQRGLDPGAPLRAPVRQVVVEGLDAGGAAPVTGTVSTDLDGRYALIVPVGQPMLVRARAQMLESGAAPTWDFRVRNNRNANALYVLDSAPFNADGNMTRDLHAASGWGGTSYTGVRAAAPFAILDTVFQARQLLLGATPATTFAQLNLFWSPDNRAAAPFCPRDGAIDSTSYVVFAPGELDGCGLSGVNGIYLLGDFAGGDTDEFDQHVIAHEFGHYVEDQFSRSDSIGGMHGADERLDLRLAFAEGWGNAYAAMALGDPVYRDSFGGLGNDFSIDLEADNSGAQGWFSEFSVGEILWDLFDGGNETGDAVALGFAPIYAVMTGPQVTTDALTSIFSFASALRSDNPAAAAAITLLLNGESISGSDAFAQGERNDGGDADVLPVYRDIVSGVPLGGVCSRSSFGSMASNKLGNRVFLRFVNEASRPVTIQASGVQSTAQSVAATDPDIVVFRAGELLAIGDSSTPGVETIEQIPLDAGTYVIEVYDFDLSGTNQPPRCMTVSVSG